MKNLRMFGLLFFCCATADRSLPRVRPLSGAEASMGYQEAVDEATRCAARDGHADAKLKSAQELKPNYWCVRFGLPNDERDLEIYFDGSKHTIVKPDAESVDVFVVPNTRDAGR